MPNIPYVEYLKSENWNNKKIAVINRQKGLCAKCGLQLDTFESTEIHHTEYSTDLRQIEIKKLKALHAKCHKKTHMNIIHVQYNETLNDGKHIFVFGSNTAGRHGKGAALTAKNHWGAQYGIGKGRTGMSYAIPTRNYDQQRRTLFNRPLREISIDVNEFIQYAKNNPDLTFLITRIGCGLAGYSDESIEPLFKNCPMNCVLPWLKDDSELLKK